MARCEKCGAKLEKEWRYCPFCGTKISRVRKLVEFGMEDVLDKLLENLETSFREIFAPNLKESKKQHVVKIKITPSTMKLVGDSFGDMYRSDDGRIEHAPQQTKPKKVVEPKTEISKTDSEIVVELIMPGIKSESELELIRLEESAEVRAHLPDKMYFKILDIPRSFALKEKSVSNDKVVLRFSIAD